MEMCTLKDLLNEYGIPLDVKKPQWDEHYCFRAQEIKRDGTILGIIIKDGINCGTRSFSQNEIMELIHKFEEKGESMEDISEQDNPNNLDTDKSHYIPGITKLFLKKDNVVKPAIFERFDVKGGRDVIYMRLMGEENAGFYGFPKSPYVFPNKDDAQSYLDKEHRSFGISPSNDIIAAFKKMPAACKPSDDKDIETEYERNYHKKVDKKLRDDLAVPEEKKRKALSDKIAADDEFRKIAAAVREDGCFIDHGTYISHEIQVEDAKARMESAESKIAEIENIRRKPYFARIDCGSSMNKLHTVYLGDTDIKGQVVSWRHPEYGNAYYQSGIMKGRGDIVLALKRLVSIVNRNFCGFDDEINLYNTTGENNENSLDNATDELLTRLLKESRADKNTHDIIKTIQGEQYDIITSDFEKNAVINGCAGSGKTMIMYHRLSYMAYNYQSYLGRDFDPDSVYIISPTDFFDMSNDELLSKLSIESVHQAPFYSQVESLLDKYCAKYNIIPFYGMIDYIDAEGDDHDNFFSSLDFSSFDTMSRAVDATSAKFKQWVLSLVNGILKKYEFKTLDPEEVPETVQEINSLFSTKDYYYNNCFVKKDTGNFYSKRVVTGISLDNVSESLNSAYNKKTQYIQRKKRIVRSMGLLKCALSLKPKTDTNATISTDISDFWNLVDSYTIYEKMLSLIVAEKLLECVIYDNSEMSDYMLKCLWTYQKHYNSDFSEYIKLYFLHSLSKQYGAIIKDPALIFIDEFQNYSSFEIKCLKEAYESPVFNLFGDYDQCIEDKGMDLKYMLSSILSPNSYNINVNYRNAKPITEYINRKVHKNMQSIGIDGTVIETALDTCDFKLGDRTAIICKDTKLAMVFLKRYIDANYINNSAATKELIKDKYTLMTVLDCKGLEFDTVYVLDYDMNENEKYVAYTRALDTLVVIHDDLEAIKKSEEEAEKKRKEEVRIAEEKRKAAKGLLVKEIAISLNIYDYDLRNRLIASITTLLGCKAEEARLAEEKRKAEEARLADEKRKAEEARLAEERRKAEEARLAEERRKAEEARLADEKRKVEEAARLAEEKRKVEEAARLAEEKRKAEEARLAEEKRKAEEARLADEKLKAEEARLAEEKLKAEEARLAEEKLKAEEARLAEEKRKAEEEEVRLENEIKSRIYNESFTVYDNSDDIIELTQAIVSLAPIINWKQSSNLIRLIQGKITTIVIEQRKIEQKLRADVQSAKEKHQLEVANAAEEAHKDMVLNTSLSVYNECNDILELTKAKVSLQSIGEWKQSKRLIQMIDKKISMINLNNQQAEYRKQQVCQYCGGQFKGVFAKRCSVCGKSKDY